MKIISVHWMTAKWVSPQLAFLDRNAGAPYRVFASLNGIDDPEVRARFDFAQDMDGKHWEKLNALTEIVIAESEPSDILVFLDGDAFPIQPLQPWLEETLE